MVGQNRRKEPRDRPHLSGISIFSGRQTWVLIVGSPLFAVGGVSVVVAVC